MIDVSVDNDIASIHKYGYGFLNQNLGLLIVPSLRLTSVGEQSYLGDNALI